MAATYSVDGQSFGSIGEVENYLSDQGYDRYTIEDNRQGGIGRQSGVGMGEGAGLLGVAGGAGGGGLFGYTSFGDMFDGGGPGRSDSTFARGPYSAALNAVGVRPAGYTERMAAGAAPGLQAQRGFNGYGYTDPATGQWVSAGRDMIDGGGPGRSGPQFSGGLFSGLLNTVGVRPAGYRQRMEDNLAPQTSLRPQMRPVGLLGGSEGTQAAVERAKVAASRGKTGAAVPEGFGQEFLDQPARSMPQNYFNELLASGLRQENITPVGQPMTGSELMDMSRYMDQARQRRGDKARPAQSRMAAAERARYARAGAPFVVPLPALRRAAGTPNASLAAVGPDAALYSYLSKERVRPGIIDTLQQPGYADARQDLQGYFKRDNMLPASALEKFR